MKTTDATRNVINALIDDINVYEIQSHDDVESLQEWVCEWENEIRRAIDEHERMICAELVTDTVVSITKKQEEILKHE